VLLLPQADASAPEAAIAQRGFSTYPLAQEYCTSGFFIWLVIIRAGPIN
jgi:hypothetical protein